MEEARALDPVTASNGLRPWNRDAWLSMRTTGRRGKLTRNLVVICNPIKSVKCLWHPFDLRRTS